MIQIISDRAEDILLNYYQHLTQHGNLSDASAGTHIAAARDFVSWYESKTGICFHLTSDAAPSAVHYQAALRAQGLHPTLIQRRIQVVHRLCDWARRYAQAHRAAASV